MTQFLRKGPSGPKSSVNGIAAGAYIGTWDGVSPDPADILQKITTGFRPKTIQIVARVTTSPPDAFNSGIQIAKVDDPVHMPGGTAFLFIGLGFTLVPDPVPGIGLVQIEDDGFVVGLAANGMPGATQVEPALPDFYSYEAEG